jgi:AhpD family alkylhydroperoxidase
MARIDYSDVERQDVKDIAADIVAQRGSFPHLYRMLLHSRPVASGWLTYLTAIRQQCCLPGDIRELVIMRVAIVNGAPYEAEQHAPIALAEGMTQAQLDDLADWEASASFDERQRAVLALTDAMTRDVHVADEVFAGAQVHFDDQGMVELVATIAAYNMVSRFLEAFDVRGDDPV